MLGNRSILADTGDEASPLVLTSITGEIVGWAVSISMDENRPRPRRLGTVIAVLALAWSTLRVVWRFRFHENGAVVDVFNRTCLQRLKAAEYMMTSREINHSACL
jgi:hypothetical protein